MKISAILSGLLLVALTTACTFQSVTHHPGLGRVILSAPPSRALSASTDVTTITYKTTDLTGLDDVKVKTGTINKYSLTADLFLTPASRYRIEIDVGLAANAPGTNVGVLKYGDQLDFDVDPYYDTYVELTARPNKAVVFDPASVTGAAATIQKVSPFDTPPLTTPTAVNLFSGPLTPSPLDRLFYGSEAKLYYFNKTANTVYQWKNIVIPDPKMGPSDIGFEGTAGTKGLDPADSFQIYAACADPLVSDVLWVVCQNTSTLTWHYARVDVSGATPVVGWSADLTVDLEAGEVGATIVPTGIAVDATYNDVYLTFYNSTGTTFQSGVLEYYNDSLFIPASNPDLTSTDSIYTDVVWDQGKLWVLTSPLTTPLGPAAANTGTARILAFNDYLETQTVFTSSVDRSFTGALPGLAGATQLVLPNRFAGPIQGTSLFVSQRSPQGGGTHGLSRVDFSGTVVTY